MIPDEYDAFHEDLATGEGMREPPGRATDQGGTAAADPGDAAAPA
ncbi:hypothetical protein [Longimicrobium sp.]|nr:hypothetical protein [Longimicrobium sp.]HEX6037924.1 hypothetical protein [Longimicrobium sp.]